jgi:transposase
MTKKTYGQIWPVYNRAQVNEKSEFQPLLRDLCAGITEPVQSRGRPRLPLADMLFCMIFKVYTGFSCRRCMSDLTIARERSFISRLPDYNSIFTYFGLPEVQRCLELLITQSSLPLSSVEKSFAVDSTGFSTARFASWLDTRYGQTRSRDRRKWVKAHIMCGVLTNIVTAVKVTDANAGDAPYFEPLLETTTEHFSPKRVMGDKAYSSLANLKFANSKGVLPVIPYRANANAVHGSGDPLWTRLYHFYSLNKEWFERVYHQRSNIESTNAMIKMKFGERLRSRTRVAQFNELLCKVLCHNICVTIQASYEIGIEPNYWDAGEEKKAA